MDNSLAVQKEYKIRKLEEKELNLLLPLMEDCFGLQVTFDFLKWKYIDNPAGSFIGFVAETTDGEIAAYYGVIPKIYSINGQHKVIYQSADTMTHSLHRRKKLFEVLANTCYGYLKSHDKLFAVGFGGDFSTSGALKLGWQFINKAYQLFCPRILVFFMGWRSSRYTVKEIKEVNLIEDLLVESNRQTVIYALKEVAPFAWRMENPLRKYNLFGVFLKGELKGYFCFYHYKNRLYLFDCYFKESRAIGGMMHFFYSEVKENDSIKGIQSFASTNSYLYKTLRKKGFIRSILKRGGLNLYLSFLIMSDKHSMHEYGQLKFWNLTPFDHDTL